jgi:hypothetical protein
LAISGKPLRWKYRLERQGDELTLQLNERTVLSQTLTGREPPWLVLRCGRMPGAIIERLVVEHNEDGATTISLPFTPTLPGWNAPAFQRDATFHPEKQTDADWRVNEARLVGAFRSDAAGSWRPSLLQHLLPLPTRSNITWSFYYEPGKSLVHPVVDASVMLLEPGDGIYIGQLPKLLRPDRVLSRDAVLADCQRLADSECNLAAGQWNQMQLEIDGTTLRLRLNDQPAVQAMLAEHPAKTFGLFHWSDQTAAQIQNLQLSPIRSPPAQ